MTLSVQLATNDESKILILSNFVGSGGDPYQCDIEISSGGFGFKGAYYFDNYSSFIASIEKMSVNLSGSAKLREDYKEQEIKLEVLSLGHVLVSGKIEHHIDHRQLLSFGFKTDQVCLAQFGSDLRRVLG